MTQLRGKILSKLSEIANIDRENSLNKAKVLRKVVRLQCQNGNRNTSDAFVTAKKTTEMESFCVGP